MGSGCPQDLHQNHRNPLDGHASIHSPRITHSLPLPSSFSPSPIRPADKRPGTAITGHWGSQSRFIWPAPILRSRSRFFNRCAPIRLGDRLKLPRARGRVLTQGLAAAQTPTSPASLLALPAPPTGLQFVSAAIQYHIITLLVLVARRRRPNCPDKSLPSRTGATQTPDRTFQRRDDTPLPSRLQFLRHQLVQATRLPCQ